MNPIDAPQAKLLEYHKIFKQNNLVVHSREASTFYNSLEVKVKVSDYVFSGYVATTNKPTIEDVVNAEIVALQFAALHLNVNLNLEVVPEPIVEKSEIREFSGYDIINTMGATVTDVYTKLEDMGFDTSDLRVYNKKLTSKGERMTKEKMAKFLFPNKKETLIAISLPNTNTTTKKHDNDEPVFRAEE